jgi:hypothetical protein
MKTGEGREDVAVIMKLLSTWMIVIGAIKEAFQSPTTGSKRLHYLQASWHSRTPYTKPRSAAAGKT